MRLLASPLPEFSLPGALLRVVLSQAFSLGYPPLHIYDGVRQDHGRENEIETANTGLIPKSEMSFCFLKKFQCYRTDFSEL